MGLNAIQWDFIYECLKGNFEDFSGVKMVELGNQHIRDSLLSKLKWSKKAAKTYFKHLGFKHVSIDINGKDGALPVDLSKKINNDEMINSFDVLTNSGTTEHVLPFKKQYQCFKNLHDIVKPGGIFIHLLPEVGSFVNHAKVYYTVEFFEKLAEMNDYEIIKIKRLKKLGLDNKVLVSVCLRKTSDKEFNSDKEKFFEHIYNVERDKMKVIKKKIDEFTMFLDASGKGISGTLKSSGAREPCFMWVLNKEAEGELAMDIGSNIGYTTLPLCREMSRVIAIEPDKRSRKLLEKSIKANGFQDSTKVMGCAMSDKVGVETIYLAKHPNLTTLCKQRDKKHTQKKKTIETMTVDNLGELPNFVKMDIEGYEVEVLRGGMSTWEKVEKCKILIEVHPQFYTEERNFADVLRKMMSLGFKFKYVISAACAVPDKFKAKGYKPFKVKSIGRWERGIYSDISEEDAINFCAYPHRQKIKGKKDSKKIVRAILLTKGFD